MTFYQEYTRQEKYFGTHTFRFVVSDTFADLFKETWDAGDGIFADIFQTGDVGKKLEGENNTQGVDELDIEIFQSHCRTDNELNAFFFTTEARDINKLRFCTVLFDPVYVDGVAIDSCVWFIGKISEKMQAQDVMWRRVGDYKKVITPVRVWKCKAYSLDISLFDKIKVYGEGNENRITLPDGSTTLPLLHLDRITDEEISAIFNFRLAWKLGPGAILNWIYFYPLGNIFKVIKMLLDHARIILREITDTDFTIGLSESNLYLLTSYLYYTFYYDKRPSDGEMLLWDSAIANQETTNDLTLLKLSNDDDGIDPDTGLHFSTPFIHRKMVNPFWHLTDEEKESNPEGYSRAVYDKKLSFISFDNLTLLLHEIARSLNCYILFSTQVNGAINLGFTPKSAFIKEDLVHIKDVTNPSINISSQLSANDSKVYFALSTIYSVDGYDNIIIDSRPGNKDMQTEKLISSGIERKDNKDVKNIDSKQLLLSSSYTTLTNIEYYGRTRTHAFNTLRIYSSGNMDYINEFEINDVDGYISNSHSKELLHSSIYIKTVTKEDDMIELLGDTPVWRPASKIFVKHNDENIEYESLSALVNSDAKLSIQYYENVYDMTVPWWSAFSKSEDGSNPSWDNIDIGSKLPLNEVIRLFNGSSWISYLHSEDTIFTVADIKRSTKYPETKIKLVNKSRYAYGIWSGEINSMNILSFTLDNSRHIDYLVDGIKVKEFDIATGNTVQAGDAVIVQNDSTVIKAKSNSIWRGKVKGIALTSGDGDNDETKSIAVQLIGNVYVDEWEFSSDDIGKQVFVRTNESGTNISTTLLFEPTDTEDLIIYLGVIDSEHSIVLDIEEYKLEETLCQP